MSVLDAAFHAAHDFPGGATARAHRMGKAPSTLNHELVGQGSAKLGLVDSVKLFHLTHDARIPQAFAMDCGGVFLPMVRDGLGADDIHALGRVIKEVGEVAAGGRSVSKNDRAGFHKEALEAICAIATLVAMVDARHEASVPSFERGAA